MDNSIKYQSFTELVVWQEARKFQLFIFNLSKSFPPEEGTRLTDQIIRASRSIAANIAEGHGRFHYQEQIQFCRQSRGSLSEVLNHTYTALDCNYIQTEAVHQVEQKAGTLLKLISGYIFFLKNQKKSAQTTQSTRQLSTIQSSQLNESNQHTKFNQHNLT
jgi:four helix bundle protein